MRCTRWRAWRNLPGFQRTSTITSCSRHDGDDDVNPVVENQRLVDICRYVVYTSNDDDLGWLEDLVDILCIYRYAKDDDQDDTTYWNWGHSIEQCDTQRGFLRIRSKSIGQMGYSIEQWFPFEIFCICIQYLFAAFAFLLAVYSMFVTSLFLLVQTR